MTVFAPDNAGPGRSRIINDPIAIQEILAILHRTAGLQIDVENNSYVIDAEVVPKGSPAKGAWGTPPPMVAPVVSNQNLERVLGQAEKDGQAEDRAKEVHEKEVAEAEISHNVTKKVASQPYAPSQREKELHEISHVPYRSWCQHCVAGKAADMPHKKQIVHEEHIPVIEFDYNFVGDRSLDDQKVTMLVAIDSVHSSLTAPIVRKKGSGDEYVMQALLNYVKQLGFAKAELKCDQEPSTVDVMYKLIDRCKNTQLVPSASPKGSKGSLGRGERGHLSVQGQVRTLRLATQEAYKTTIDANNVLMPWMTRHSAWVIDRCQPRWNGQTAYKSLRGKDYTGTVLRFAETALFHAASNSDKLTARWIKGILVGKIVETDEFLYLTEEGAKRSRSVKRLTENEVWDSAFL